MASAKCSVFMVSLKSRSATVLLTFNILSYALADKFKGVWEFGLDYDFYDRYFHSVKNVKPKELRDLANKYLNGYSSL